jgi:lysine-specific demethylase 8
MLESHRPSNSRYNLYWLLTHVSAPKVAFDTFDARRKKVSEQFVNDFEVSRTPALVPVPRAETASVHKVDFRKPIIFPGAAKTFPAYGKWTPEFFAEHYGDAVVPYVDNFKDRGGELEYATIREVVDKLDSGTLKYAKFCGLMHEHPELCKDFQWDVNKTLLPERTFLSSMQFFLGGAGTKTLTHCAISLNVFVQIYGQKRWVIYPPSVTPAIHPVMDRAPYFRSSASFEEPDPLVDNRYGRYPGYECTLEPGDIMYNPPYYWHYVSNPTVSIGVSFKYQNPWASLRTAPWMFLMSMLATKPNVVSGFLQAQRGKNLMKMYDPD